jgi:pseudouridine-5'-phosphate glycosidase
VTLLVADEVAEAVASGGPVVALETSVIGQGLPQPRNLECVERMSGAIRAAGAVPAWIGLVDGVVLVGLAQRQLERFATSAEATKVARRDIPTALARGDLGATTVSATIWAAHRAGIAIAATGGTGGVHPGVRPDVSADLWELARTPVLLVCSGPKSIVDPLATAEKLEELGVAVIGYGVDRLPFFLARETTVELEHRVDTPEEAAELARAQRTSGIESAILLCNAVPAAHAMDADEVVAATHRVEERREAAGVTGKAVTPFLLAALAEETGGRSLDANLDLLQDNARVAAEVAMAASRTGLGTA